jgi:hypothetical protein
LLGAFLPVETAQRIFAKGVPPMAGMIQAKGKAEPVTGGYRVTGRWAFGSAFTTLIGSLLALSYPTNPCQRESEWFSCPDGRW